MIPRIGITPSFVDGEQRLRREYVLAIEEAGGLPCPCPMVSAGETRRAFVETLDGLMVTGGPAVTDGLVGHLPDDLGTTDPLRLTADKHWIDLCDTARLPIIGICYGMQLLNARAGGTIYGDVEVEVEGALTHSQKRGAANHLIQIEHDSRLYDALRTQRTSVNTRHLQAIATVGEGFRITATAPDGTIEAIEHENGRILGLQFHPERMRETMMPLFRMFVEQARTARAASPA
ncbi:gamma-glutamyl-gamma-aminobutyrate hydrolase [Longibacter salinarum]|uniref:Gamma-glutamyl-gamma-aminobutyrate hydrolase n=1 Tax=Longibacter salinarum TaxID=1850348 RepID=A0A2A8CW21_9BACT|nr:gamma-glutamyl-gamma-aminobutyrate hydrolase family protein [Longibacter salinarum]PEN12905.1 gamma-glutamyl-gamma-aminobutyrate hydrolase [Longibacter salinarum]